MKKLKIRENDNTIYVTLLFDHENIAHQISITINPHYLHCEAVPPSFASKEFFKKLSQILGEPAEKTQDKGKLLRLWRRGRFTFLLAGNILLKHKN